MTKYSDGIVPAHVSERLFRQACKKYKKPFEKAEREKLSFQEFHSFFATDEVAGNVRALQTQAMKAVKAWMRERRISSAQAF